jgi:hypothetical protein
MTTQSWSYDKNVPLHPVPLAVHSTYYGSSSLAASSSHDLVVDEYSKNSLYSNYKRVNGVPKSNTTIYDHDKPALGVMQAREAMDERFLRQKPMETVPNVNVLKSKYTLHDMNSRPTALM